MKPRGKSGRDKRKRRIRKKIFGTSEQPRLTVFRSLRHIYAQIIDDTEGKTLASASTMEKGNRTPGKNKPNAESVGQRLAERALAAKVEKVVFDRNGYIYHGCLKSLADAAREKGLRF